MKFVKPFISFLASFLLFAGNLALAQNAYIQTDVLKIASVPAGITASQISTLPAASKSTTFVYLNGMGTPVQKVGYQQSPNTNDVVQIYQYDQYGQQAIRYLPYVDDNTQNVQGSYRATALTDQQNYYINNSTNLNKVASDPLPFSQELFENSPLRRLFAAGSVGLGFQPLVQDNSQHYTVISYRNNTIGTPGDNVMMIAAATGAVTPYAANALTVVDGKDADNVETQVFTNSMGQVILKRQLSGQSAEPNYDTYYVYNANGSIAYVIPPKASNLIANGATNITAASFSNLIYAYTYDALGRVITRQAPNTGPVSLVYDPMNRLVLVQDGVQAGNNQWNYIKYDAQNRPISTGVYTDILNVPPAGSGLTRQFVMQAYVTQYYGTNFYELRSSNQANGYYTNNCFPSQNLQPLGYDFYDDYDLSQAGSPFYSYQPQGLVNSAGVSIEATPVTVTQGMLTMSIKISVGPHLANGLTNIWLSKAYFYDKHNNVIQVLSNNQLNYLPNVMTDSRTLAPDFIGKPLQVKVVKVTGTTSSPVPNSVLTTYTYDVNNARIQSVSQAYNNQAPVTLANYAYNEMGQLVTKVLGQVTTSNIPFTRSLNTTYSGTNTVMATGSVTLASGFNVPWGSTLKIDITSGYLQTLDYRYNIRNQLLTINNSTLSNDNGVTNSDNTDLFGMTYLYDGTDPNLTNTNINANTNIIDKPSYTGKISAVKWSYKYNKGASTSNERSYVYQYDQLGQLSSALYAERAPSGPPTNPPSTSPFTVNMDGFDETNITYDDDGNIKTLQRNYLSNISTTGTGTVTPLDNLKYTYGPNSNGISYPDQLQQVSDAVTTTIPYGFNNVAAAPASSSYVYDADGNLTSDPYKGITISYNLINRTNVITASGIGGGSTISYTYADANTVLEKQVVNSSSTTTDYIDEFVYTNGVIAYFGMPEGRVVNVNGTLKPEYIITDQQGNARFSFQDNGSGAPLIIQETSYYAFGAVMPNSLVPAAPSTNNPNLYNGGSEWQNAFQNLPDYYQTGARNYDPELGRFISVDPMAELSASLSNYHYAGNNPIMGNDPTGNCDYDDGTNGGSSGDTGNSGSSSSSSSSSTTTQVQGGGSADQTIVDNPTGEVPPSPTSSGGVYNQQSSGNTSSTGSTTSANVSSVTGTNVATEASYGDYTSYVANVNPPVVYAYEGYDVNNVIADYFANQRGIRPISITVGGTPIGQAAVWAYPYGDQNIKYIVPTYPLIVKGTDTNGNTVSRTFEVIRFGARQEANGRIHMVGLSDAQSHVVYRWYSDYMLHSTDAGEAGAWVVYGGYYIHDGPDDRFSGQFGNAGCLEVVGAHGFTILNVFLLQLSGANSLSQLGASGTITVTYQHATKPFLIPAD